MRQSLKIHVHIILLPFLLLWGTSLVCTIIGHHATERNYTHAHFSISVPIGDHLPAAHNTADYSGDSTVSHELASLGLVTFHSGHTGTTESASGQPLIVSDFYTPSANLWEFLITQPIGAPSETFLLPPDRPPAFPV